MSFTTFIGVIVGFGLFIFSIILSTNNYWIFVSGPSLLMVIGGTFAATLIG